jgi:hypothetical protein
MDLNYIIAQAFGIFATICCFAMPLFKRKWQMLLINVAGNLFFILNLLLLGYHETGDLFANATAMIVNVVSLVQVLISFYHVQKGTPVTTAENIIFLLLYVGLGFVGFNRALDLLPIVASVFNMLAVFQKDEQKTRYLVLCNASIFCAYYIILGSTSLLAELMAVITTVIALIKYRKKA